MPKVSATLVAQQLSSPLSSPLNLSNAFFCRLFFSSFSYLASRILSVSWSLPYPCPSCHTATHHLLVLVLFFFLFFFSPRPHTIDFFLSIVTCPFAGAQTCKVSLLCGSPISGAACSQFRRFSAQEALDCFLELPHSMRLQRMRFIKKRVQNLRLTNYLRRLHSTKKEASRRQLTVIDCHRSPAG